MNFETISFNKIQYVCCDKILEKAPIYSKGCKNTRSLIKTKKIPDDMYIYAKENDAGKWTKTNGKSIRFDKILIKRDFLKEIPELNRKSGEIIVAEDGTKEAPEIIYLDNNEKFKDDEGNIIDIETRGERTCDGVYFKVSDVSIGFQMDRLNTTISDQRCGYKIGEDFIFFFCGSSAKGKKEKKIKKELFLTYSGMVRALFTARSGKTNGFIKWATKKLFTVQMGTDEQKEELAAGVLGIAAKTLREVLSTTLSNISCIYMFAFGKCKDLRKTMKLSSTIPDDYVIIKYGYTDDLVRRTKEHMKTYNSIKGVNLELMHYVHIDPKYLSQAETDIKNFFNDIETKVEYENFIELAAINPKHEKQIINQYKYINGKYTGYVINLASDIKDLEIKVKDLENNIEKQKLEYQIELQNERNKTENERHKTEKLSFELEKKTLEIENINLKAQLMSSNEKIVPKINTKKLVPKAKTSCKNIKQTDNIKQDDDIYLNFLNECTEKSDTHVRTSNLYKAFIKRFVTNNPKTHIPSNKDFTSKIKKHVLVERVRVGGNTVNGIKNLKLSNDCE